MKKIAFVVFGLLLFSWCNAQQSYTVDGKEYQLKSEISGTLELLWNTIDGEFRYFIKKGSEITELTNTRDSNNKYQEEYKGVLQNLTDGNGSSTQDVKLTLPSLRDFVYNYNKSVDASYSEENKKADVRSNLLVFGGITNHPFVENPENANNLAFGAEIEFYEANNLPRHSIFFQLKHAASSDDFDYSSTQFGLGYRFRFLRQEAVNIYANVMLATYSFVNFETSFNNQVIDKSRDGFEAPLYFGIGADIRVSDRSFITIAYDELFAVSLENQGNFSTNISIGYKFEL